MNKVTEFYQSLWHDYLLIAPQVEKVHQLFATTDGVVVNDHVAFRTFAHTPVSLDKLETVILSLGYERQDSYQFKEKKLRAHSYIHPDNQVPKVFCSELLTEQLSEASQAIIARYTDQISEATALTPELFWSGRHWNAPTWDEYQQVLAESEYGAWLLALGLRANHFTVSVNHLKSSHSIEEVLHRVKQAGFSVNTSGGEVKGSPAALLEQGSTMADKMMILFAGDDPHEIPTCFYEFARRYPDPDNANKLYQGFREANADKIFESTHAS